MVGKRKSGGKKESGRPKRASHTRALAKIDNVDHDSSDDFEDEMDFENPQPSTSSSQKSRSKPCETKTSKRRKSNQTEGGSSSSSRSSPEAVTKQQRLASDSSTSVADSESSATKKNALKLKKLTGKERGQLKKFEKQKKYLSGILKSTQLADNNGNIITKKMSKNFCDLHYGLATGKIRPDVYEDSSRSALVDNISKFSIWKMATPFDRRITAIAWHPDRHSLAAIGSKGGDLLLCNFNDEEDGCRTDVSKVFRHRLEGRGPGGSIQSLIFDKFSESKIYLASIDGKVALRDFEGRGDQVFLDTMDWERWYTGLDVSFSGRTILTGSNNGNVTLLAMDGTEIWTHRLHKTKANFVQFSQQQPWMVVTSSVDNVVKIWDIRNISGKDSALVELAHEKPVNCAYFSRLRGDKLLTTDQHSQLRVYQGPCWRLQQTIPHPHRQFQHLTPVKATWHPLGDLVVAGRYPDPNFPGYHEGELRTIDVMCPDTGRALAQLHQPGMDKIISLNSFNNLGDLLLSGAAASVLVWKQRDQEEDAVDEVPTDSNNVDYRVWPDFSKKIKKPREKKTKTATK